MSNWFGRVRWLCALGVVICCVSEAQAAERLMRLSPGARASFALKENPSTGYVWQIDPAASSNLAILRIEDGGFYRPQGRRPRALIGAPGLHRWSVTALSKGRARIEFVKQRPWEKTPVERSGLSVEVQ